MKKNALVISLLLLITSCLTKDNKNTDFIIAFGSCNNQDLTNELWPSIQNSNPDLWIWGGDIIYSDTDDMAVLQKNYQKQKSQKGYEQLMSNTDLMGTWDDHDYGMNDGGASYPHKWASQQLFLDFFDVPQNSPRRLQKGVYEARDFKVDDVIIKVITLDTRYFRSALNPNLFGKKRYIKSEDPKATILGDQQWKWLSETLQNSKANYHVILTSIQFLSDKHGFETWGNFPLEQERLKSLLVLSKVNNPIILSGDRHISEFTEVEVKGLDHTLVDFTSSGMTHAYTNFTSEDNPSRKGRVISEKSFGVMNFDIENETVNLQMIGLDGKVLQEINQSFKSKQ